MEATELEYLFFIISSDSLHVLGKNLNQVYVGFYVKYIEFLFLHNKNVQQKVCIMIVIRNV